MGFGVWDSGFKVGFVEGFMVYRGTTPAMPTTERASNDASSASTCQVASLSNTGYESGYGY